MPPFLSTVDAALRDAREALRSHYGPRLSRVVLFGSHARGEATEDSDVDVLVVLRDAVDLGVESHFLGRLSVRLLGQHGELVTFLPVPEARFADRHHPLMAAVHEEGVGL